MHFECSYQRGSIIIYFISLSDKEKLNVYLTIT